ncbi:MAG: NYN domain-containing protein, partial [Nostoc sp.]
WSDYRLRPLKNEIQELGIEAIQIFDYSHRRNAADMQLAIDIMELAQSRPTLKVFVIVSGDGAFAALAKKLHEYGKTVIGCAYEVQINRIFKSV